MIFTGRIVPVHFTSKDMKSLAGFVPVESDLYQYTSPVHYTGTGIIVTLAIIPRVKEVKGRIQSIVPTALILPVHWNVTSVLGIYGYIGNSPV